MSAFEKQTEHASMETKSNRNSHPRAFLLEVDKGIFFHSQMLWVYAYHFFLDNLGFGNFLYILM
jgi:hypothetical protein